MSTVRLAILIVPALLVGANFASGAEPVNISGIYPQLAMFNNEGECGTGAVVPWANRLWVITYGPHLPFGSSDKLYEITPELQQIVRPESVGGTPANRLIHRESNQLAIGPYLIDANGKVRVIPPKLMPGRLTGTARHLTDPANKLYYATMEEGLYEVDVRSLEIKGLIVDGNKPGAGQTDEKSPATVQSKLPGYHGKGLYSAQGRLVYANNGERSEAALRDPTIPSGALAEWKGAGDWELVRRNQFTEVTGPGGILGNSKETDPLWSMGWDAKSLILMVLDGGQWHAFRLPKASHSYDGAHGWNTEWPRIRDIGEPGKTDLLMTMHGMFWRFPATFTAKTAAGIRPRSSYLKVIGDFCRWNDGLVMGCDDTAKSEFLNKRKMKGDLAGPGQSQSNLWFIQPELLDQLGPVIGRGAVWLNDEVAANKPTDPFLVAGFEHRSLVISHDHQTEVTFTIEMDEKGDGQWKTYRKARIAPQSSSRLSIPAEVKAEWLRIRSSADLTKATAVFQLSNPDRRKPVADEIFAGIAKPAQKELSGGVIYARGANLKTLRFAAKSTAGGEVKDLGSYDLDANLKLIRVDDPKGPEWAEKNYAIPTNVITIDEASVLNIDEQGRRWRLPKGDLAFDHVGPFGAERVDREVCTERDLLNVHGTFYELPAENAGGFAKVRPVATHNRRIHDYCSYRGLLVVSGIEAGDTKNPHLITSDDGLCKLWVGAVDDLWKFGKPRGVGGPWKQTKVTAKEVSDPYLMTGYDQKRLTIEHGAAKAVTFRIEADFTGTGTWSKYEEVEVPAGAALKHVFPADFSAYWVRLVPSENCTATAIFTYE
ncbi:hypothetical protein ETAA8_49570 [Anatilimnocola aggregata]|uniref:Uncharacterized protein n=1 Tax=Anatilimnocola aggregata TaxID=2528021 RepID=A0A517YI04_9BACT|nr:hypothetical protein [Anatilimnocola aggregata]QDU29842.1 hypothetical protein ETAA8_49570 [Anatilimnocola aggregata]